MLYTALIRPWLFKKDPEEAHLLAISRARTLSQYPGIAELVRNWMARPKDSPRTVGGLTFPNPIGLAAGMDKNAECSLAWWAFGFGFVELGTVTPKDGVIMLRAEVVGANPKSEGTKAYFGLDCVVLTPAE